MVLLDSLEFAFDFGALHRHDGHIPAHVLQVLTVELQRLIQPRRSHVQRKVLHLTVQGPFDVAAEAHAKLNGRVLVMVDDHSDVASVADHHIHQEPGGSFQMGLGQGSNVFCTNHVLHFVETRRKLRRQKRGLVASILCFVLSFRCKSTQFKASELPSLHVVHPAHD